MNDPTVINIEPYAESGDIPEMPEECAESERAIEQLREVSQEDKFTFINIIVLAVVLLACAAYFISMTSSKKFSDEGNKFSAERFLNGKFTAEISRRYYSTIAYPEGIDELAGGISRLYGFGDGVDYTDGSVTGAPDNSGKGSSSTPSGGGKEHKEEAVTSASETDKQSVTEQPPEVQTFYDSVFSRTTTVSTELGWDPDDPYSHNTTPTTTVVMTAPSVESTTTAEPSQTDSETVSSSETLTESSKETETPTQSSQDTETETSKDTETVTEEITCDTETQEPPPPEIPDDPGEGGDG
ncbi:MAG: hypothetical protein IKP95_06255 [Ruminococcus sp.]|nr:hypothetical protein [Ruminococcus sp.]